MSDYTPVTKPKIKTYPFNKVTVTWNHGFQHSFMCIGHTLRGQLESLDGNLYVSKVEHCEATEEEYRSFYGGVLTDENEGPAKTPKKKNPKVEKVEKSSMPQFSSLENFFGSEALDDKKVGTKKGPAKNPGKIKMAKKRV